MAPGSANKGSWLLTVRSQTDSCFGQYVCNGGAATMGRCLNCYIMRILEFGNCELADGTRFERSGCDFTSCRASLRS